MAHEAVGGDDQQEPPRIIAGALLLHALGVRGERHRALGGSTTALPTDSLRETSAATDTLTHQ